jgi:predicted DNA binding CopG/RHH family protein
MKKSKTKYTTKTKVKYTAEPIGDIEIVEDFLPKPQDLVLKEETAKITLNLTKSSIDFFKKEAVKHNTHYQTMIRALIDRYSSHFVQQGRQ